MAGELDRAIAVAIRSLPTRFRDPFLLATAHQHRYDDIAEWLGCRSAPSNGGYSRHGGSCARS